MDGILTIEDYLRTVSPLIGDEALRYVLVRRKIDSGTAVTNLSERDLDLAEGLCYAWLTNLPTITGTVKDADGDWSHSEGGWQISKDTIAEWKRKCKQLFDKWNEEAPVQSGIRLINLC